MSGHTIGVRSEDLEQIAKEGSSKTLSLMNQPLSSLFKDQSRAVVSVGQNTPVRDAFKALLDNKILSVPVHSNKSGRYTRFIDILDILQFFLAEFGRDIMKGGYDTISTSEGFQKPCKAIANLSQRNAFHSLGKETPISSVAKIMSKERAHRVAVLDTDGRMIGLVSQSTIVAWIAKDGRELSLMSKKLSDITMKTSGVVSVKMNTFAIDGLCKLVEEGVSAVAVVDDDGKLVTNVSASDLKRVGYDNYMFGNLFVPLEGFLLLGDNDIIPAISVSRDATIAEIVDLLAEKHIHRLYVVDEDNRPVDVVSLGDIIDLLAAEE